MSYPVFRKFRFIFQKTFENIDDAALSLDDEVSITDTSTDKRKLDIILQTKKVFINECMETMNYILKRLWKATKQPVQVSILANGFLKNYWLISTNKKRRIPQTGE